LYFWDFHSGNFFRGHYIIFFTLGRIHERILEALGKRAICSNGLTMEHTQMPKLAKQENDASYKVVQVPAYAPAVINGKITDKIEKTDGFHNVRLDTGKCLGHVSDRYGIVDNDVILGRCEQAFDHHGLNVTDRNVVVTQDGARMRTVYTFGNDAYRVGNDKSNDLALQIVAQNSFDRSLSPALMAGFVRMICSNGQFSMEREVSLVGRHTQQFNVDNLIADEAMEKIMKRIKASLAPFEKMSAMDITQTQGLNILQGLTRKGLIAERNRERVATIWNDSDSDHANQRSVYGLYQSVTQFLRDQSTDRWENADKTGRSILRTLDKVSTTKASVKAFATLPKSELIKN